MTYDDDINESRLLSLANRDTDFIIKCNSMFFCDPEMNTVVNFQIVSCFNS